MFMERLEMATDGRLWKLGGGRQLSNTKFRLLDQSEKPDTRQIPELGQGRKPLPGSIVLGALAHARVFP